MLLVVGAIVVVVGVLFAWSRVLFPVWILVALLLGGELFGLPGVIVAVPVAASLRVILLHALKAYRESAVYLGTDDNAPK